MREVGRKKNYVHLGCLYFRISIRDRRFGQICHCTIRLTVHFSCCHFLRLQSLEKKILIEAGETPAIVYEMKKQVDSFREKLEVGRKPSFV